MKLEWKREIHPTYIHNYDIFKKYQYILLADGKRAAGVIHFGDRLFCKPYVWEGMVQDVIVARFKTLAEAKQWCEEQVKSVQ